MSYAFLHVIDSLNYLLFNYVPSGDDSIPDFFPLVLYSLTPVIFILGYVL